MSIVAAANILGADPSVLGAPNPIAQAWVTPVAGVKFAPKSVEWNNPLSVETHTSPALFVLLTTFTGLVDEPRLPAVAEKVAPKSVDR